MADRIDDMAEIHRIIFETPDSSDDSFSSWSDNSGEDSGSNSELESAAMPRGVEQREQASTSTAPARRVLVGRCRQQQRAAQQNPPIEWSATNERFFVRTLHFTLYICNNSDELNENKVIHCLIILPFLSNITRQENFFSVFVLHRV